MKIILSLVAVSLICISCIDEGGLPTFNFSKKKNIAGTYRCLVNLKLNGSRGKVDTTYTQDIIIKFISEDREKISLEPYGLVFEDTGEIPFDSRRFVYNNLNSQTLPIKYYGELYNSFFGNFYLGLGHGLFFYVVCEVSNPIKMISLHYELKVLSYTKVD